MAKLILEKAKCFYDRFDRKAGDKMATHYCPGCTHGVLHKLIAEAIDDLEIQDKTVMVSPVGCSVFAYYYFDTGNFQVAHGRGPAVGTGISRSNPDSIVLSYQGDGDLASIGTNNIINAANRGEQMGVFFVNNAIYGMTGGQCAPTSLIGMKTTTTPYGRTMENEGFPIRMAEIIANLEAPVYVERCALWDIKEIMKARTAVRKALQIQKEGKGFTFLEFVSTCPSGWKMNPVDSCKWAKESMGSYYKLGKFKDVSEERQSYTHAKPVASEEEVKKQLGLLVEDPKQYDTTPKEEKYKNPAMKIAGFGGQGILMLGIMMANAGMEQGFNSSWIPSYGPEMRGGTANCFVNISTERIGSPTVPNPDVLIAFNRPSLEKFEAELKEGGLLMYDSSLIDIEPSRKDLEVVPVPATQLADDLGTTRVANSVMIGAYLAKTGIMTLDAIYQTLDKAIKRKNLLDLNVEAIKKGYDYFNNMK